MSRGAEPPRGREMPPGCGSGRPERTLSVALRAGGTVITIINNYRRAASPGAALAKPCGNCSLDLGAGTWQGERANVRAALKGELEGRGGCQAPSPLAPSLPPSLAWTSACEEGSRAGGGESPRFSALGSSPEEAGAREGWDGRGDLGLAIKWCGLQSSIRPPGKLDERGTTLCQKSCP